MDAVLTWLKTSFLTHCTRGFPSVWSLLYTLTWVILFIDEGTRQPFGIYTQYARIASRDMSSTDNTPLTVPSMSPRIPWCRGPNQHTRNDQHVLGLGANPRGRVVRYEPATLVVDGGSRPDCKLVYLQGADLLNPGCRRVSQNLQRH